jgi:release factor glutamine methyltransferase
VTDRYDGISIDRARRILAAQLRSGGIESAELDARMLVGAALGVDLTGIIVAAGRTIAESEASRIESFGYRRLNGEPVARILGLKEFWGLPFHLSPATLVPRPDTETVVELALEICRTLTISDRKLVLADIGTGSGAILLALLHELPTAVGVGTDINVAALQVARRNADELGMGQRTLFVACDYMAALTHPVDLIVSNPPYIRSGEIGRLAKEVCEYDPLIALAGGADGLDAYRSIIPHASRLLAGGGALVVEMGHDQSVEIEHMMTSAGLVVDIPAKADLAGVPRALAGRKMPR